MSEAEATAQSEAPVLDRFIAEGELRALIERAFNEDLGGDRVDVTSRCIVPESAVGVADMRPRKPGRLCGAALLPMLARGIDDRVQVELIMQDGSPLAVHDRIATLRGPLRSILAVERTALNFVTHLSGIATLTARYVAAVAGTKARVYDTRKTIPGLRRLAKYAVACGGGCSHRMGLHDAVLIKDNHLAPLGEGFGEALERAVAAARGAKPTPGFIEVEVDTLEQLEVVLRCGADVVLLDNMSLDEMREAVRMRDEEAPGVELEASGGISLETVGEVARTGVDRIAVGALTHSAAALDVGLDLR